jgi:hypothetical protein
MDIAAEFAPAIKEVADGCDTLLAHQDAICTMAEDFSQGKLSSRLRNGAM